MNIVIRADASFEVATGHIMRCLTLAEELRGTHRVSFICRQAPGNLIVFIEQQGYCVYTLPGDIDFTKDMELTTDIFENQLSGSIDWLIVDHYSLDTVWESHIRKTGCSVMVIDDLVSRRHDCDLLLNQNFSLKKNPYKQLVPDYAYQLLGPAYALLRPEFLELRKCMDRRGDKVRQILIFMGGCDPTGETIKAIKAIQMLKVSGIETSVVIGKTNSNREHIETLIAGIDNITCRFDIRNMAELMVAADICIGAGGSTTWERCCLGLPSVVTVIADNQQNIADSLDKSGFVKNLGWYSNVTEDDICNAVEDLICDVERRTQMSRNGMQLVDGQGVCRVVRSMEGHAG